MPAGKRALLNRLMQRIPESFSPCRKNRTGSEETAIKGACCKKIYEGEKRLAGKTTPGSIKSQEEKLRSQHRNPPGNSERKHRESELVQ